MPSWWPCGRRMQIPHGRDCAQRRQLTLGQFAGAQFDIVHVYKELGWQQQALQRADVLFRGTVARAWSPHQRCRQRVPAAGAQACDDLFRDLDRQLEQGKRHGEGWPGERDGQRVPAHGAAA